MLNIVYILLLIYTYMIYIYIYIYIYYMFTVELWRGEYEALICMSVCDC
jgi:hypothetical protein